MIKRTIMWHDEMTFSNTFQNHQFKSTKNMKSIYWTFFSVHIRLSLPESITFIGTTSQPRAVAAPKHPINHHYKEYRFFISWSNHQMYQCHFYILIVSRVPSIFFLFLYQSVMICYVLMQHEMNLFDICCNIFVYHYCAR